MLSLYGNDVYVAGGFWSPVICSGYCALCLKCAIMFCVKGRISCAVQLNLRNAIDILRIMWYNYFRRFGKFLPLNVHTDISFLMNK